MDPALRDFTDLVRAPEHEIDLALGALAPARVEYPDLVVEHHLEALDELAARSGTAGVEDPLRALHRLREFLFDEEGFRGNADDYYDPANSCMNQVLERKLGIQITLSVLMMEVARRVGLRVYGIGLPGHFVVSALVGTESVLLDPFDGGALLTQDTAADVVARVAAGQFIREAIAVVKNRQFIEFCEHAGDRETATLYRDVIEPDERYHHELGRSLLLRLAATPEAQAAATAAARRTLALAEELQRAALTTAGVHHAPGC